MLSLSLLTVLACGSVDDLSTLKAALRDARRREDPAAEVEALRSLALLGVDRGPDDAAAPTALIGEALTEGSPAARVEAARLLPLGLHRPTAVDSLSRGLRECEKAFAAQKKKAGKGSPDVRTQTRDGVRRPTGEVGELLDTAEAIVGAMKELPDESHVDALLRLLKADAIPGSLQLQTVHTLVHYGDQESLAALRHWMERLDRERPEDESSDPPGDGSSVSVSSSMKRGEIYEQICPPATRYHLEAARTSLRDWAMERELEAAPEPGERSATWKKWFAAVSRHCPAKAGEAGGA